MEEANANVADPVRNPQSSASTTGAAGDPNEEFGANEWLVEEMYERYQADPGSVEASWATYFKSREAPNGEVKTSASGSPNGATAPPADAPEPAPAKTAPPKTAPPKTEGTITTADDSAAASAAVTRTTGVAKAVAPTVPAVTRADAPPAKTGGAPVPKEKSPSAPADASDEPTVTQLRGAPARTAQNMDLSRTVPTATSVRSVPVKLLWDNRIVINNHLARARGGKVSFTHLIGYALVRALREIPDMNNSYAEVDGKPNLVVPAHINLGLAIDMKKADGSRQLVVPSIKGAEAMDFAQFWTAYEEIVRKARDGKLGVTDFQGTTCSLTNVGGLGTNHSVPRLMPGQSVIVGVGSMEYPPEYQGASEETLTRNAVSRIMTLTSTYDHRVIQGAQSGEFLRRLHQLLLGEDGFYDEVFRALRVPYEPIHWGRDISTNHDEDISKQARVLELIHAYRVRGHMMADTEDRKSTRLNSSHLH